MASGENLKNASHDTLITFLRGCIKIYGEPKVIKSGKSSDFISKEHKQFCIENKINRGYGTLSLNTGTELVEETIQSMKNVIKAILEMN